MMPSAAVDRRLRRFLLWLAMLAFSTTVIELWLEDHTRQPLQWIPWILCGMGLIALGAALLRPQPRVLRALRGVMALVALGGLVGIAVHLIENWTFEQEVHPQAVAGAALLATLKGAAPLLAPGVLIFGALLALAATYQHPVLRPPQPEGAR